MEEWRRAFELFQRVAPILTVHFALVVVTIFFIWLVENFITLLWGEEELVLVGDVTLRTVVKVMDISVLVVFIGNVIYETHIAFRKTDKRK
jgi:hypothetical protein